MIKARTGNGEFIISGWASHAEMESMRCLPALRWNKTELIWHCRATLAAAWRLTKICDHCDDGIKSLAAEFQKQSSPVSSEQPAIRKADLWPHQARAYQFVKQRDSALLNMWMGTGKTLVVISLLNNDDSLKSCIILCPTKVRGVWRREFAKWGLRNQNVLILDSDTQSIAKKKNIAEQFVTVATAEQRPFAIVVNYECAMTAPFCNWATERPWDVAILDESHRIKNGASKTSRFCHKLGEVTRKRICLSGTPWAHTPLDIFSQAKFLDPGYFGSSWPHFRAQYAISGHFGANHIVGYKNLQALSDTAAIFTFTAGKDVLKDLPPITENVIECALGPKGAEIYASMEECMIAQVRNETITASNALVKLLRLQQITSGVVPLDDDSGESQPAIIDTEKRNTLSEIIADIPADEPIVVFARFRADLEMIRQAAEKNKRTYGEISGQRKDLTESGTMPDGIGVLGVQIQSGGVGIDLSRSHYVIYFSIGFSLGDYEQSMSRCHRPGQEKHTFIYHIVAKNTVDEKIYDAISKRRNIIEEVIQYLKQKGEHA